MPPNERRLTEFPAYVPPEVLAAEAREAVSRRPAKPSKERFQDLVRKGWVDARGQVTTLLGGEAKPEPNYETWSE